MAWRRVRKSRWEGGLRETAECLPIFWYAERERSCR